LYLTDEALATAWGLPGTTLASAQIPSPAERRTGANGNLRHPSAERKLLDFNRFTQEALADFVVESARIVREETRGKKLSLSFYGYNFNEFLGNPNGPAETGQGAYRKLLTAPEIDIICAPISYADRRMAQGGPCMSTAESVTLAGKLWLQEDDTATYLVTENQKRGSDPAVRNRPETKEDTIQVLRRNLAQTSIRNMATWWMDLPGTGWYDDPDLWKVMEDLKEMDEAFLRNPAPFSPEVAAFIDEASMLSLVTDRAIRKPLFGIGLASFNRLGAPYGQYLLDDLVAGRVKAKLNVLLSSWALDDGSRAALKKNLEGRAKLWVWAPGYADAKNFSLSAMRELTGFNFTKLPSGTTAKIEATEAGKALGLPKRFGPDGALEPLLTPVLQPGDEVLALYGNRSPALVVRKSPEGASIFCGTLELPTPLLRHAAKLAGTHLFTSVDANVWACGDYLSIHAAEEGTLSVNTGNTRAVRDLIRNERVGRGPDLNLPLKKGETCVLFMEP
jgi:beta-galactosidase